MRYFRRAVPHITLVLSLMTITFFVIDRVNTGMAFMTSELSKWVFFALALFALVGSLTLIGYFWRDEARAARKRSRRDRDEDEARAPKTSRDRADADDATEGVWDSEEDA